VGLSYEEGLRMARLMKEHDLSIRKAIEETIAANHGVVALRFTDGCREMTVEVLDEPFDPNVRIYPG